MKKERSGRRVVGRIALAVFAFICLLLTLALRWGVKTWATLTLDQILIQLSLPIEGTPTAMLASFGLECALPAALAAVAIFWISGRIRPGKGRRLFCALALLLSAASLATSVVIAWNRFDAASFFSGEYSQFVDDNYADPERVKLSFPEKKRNLIYIFLESMETTYADRESGGAFDENCIPELTALAKEYEDFSGDSDQLNGGVSLTGSGWTVGAMVAQSSGLPMKYMTNELDTMQMFLPDMRNLGDILEANGYQQVILMGSNAFFGGRDKLYLEHGDYAIEDLNYAREAGWIPEDYSVWWGYEDEKLFDFARQELLRLSEDDAPFNLTLLTVDTHFENGYVCRLCGDEFGDNQYANVMACSSRQVTEFVHWVQQQDFYEDTAIVISGDHPTMDTDFCNDVPEDYARKTYTAFINAAVQPELDARRDFSTMDMFPTTLAAMGVDIEGDRLALGTNLFSGTPTLSERFGYATQNAELNKHSKVLDALQSVSLDEDRIAEHVSTNYRLEDSDPALKLVVMGANNPLYELKTVFVDVESEGSGERWRLNCELEEQVFVSEGFDPARLAGDTCRFTVQGANREGKILKLDEFSWTDAPELKRADNFLAYVRSLAGRDYTILISAKDEASSALTEEADAALKGLGLEQSLLGMFRHSYIAVVDRGKLIAENIGEKKLELVGWLSSQQRFKIASAGFDAGDLSSIQINGEEYSPNGRGLNFVVIDPDTGEVISTRTFDTCVTLG